MERLDKLRKEIIRKKLDACIITDSLNRRYISGFTGTSGVLIITTEDKNFFITDFRYINEAKNEIKNFKIIESRDFDDTIKKILEKEKLKKVGFESDSITVHHFNKLKKLFKKFELVPTLNLVEKLRAIKEEKEITYIKNATEISINSLNAVLKLVKPGIKEMDLAVEIEYQMKKYGAQASSFDLIVAGGERSALPHAKASNKKLKNRELIIFDIGANYLGYHSDLTRTFCLGIIGRKEKRIYNIVYQARERAISGINADVETYLVDFAGRDFIKRHGYGKFFGHGVGHGIGLSIHELPYINLKKGSFLKENMVVTIEPGIYINSFGGVRIEDSVVVKKDGYELLSTAPNKLVSL